MRFIAQPQRHVVLSGSWRIRERGRFAGSGWRLGCCLSPAPPACPLGLVELAFDRRDVGVDRFLEQAALLGRVALRLGGELQPLEHRHLVRHLLDEQLHGRDLALAMREEFAQLFGVEQAEVGSRHGRHLAWNRATVHRQMRQLRQSTRMMPASPTSLPGQAQHEGVELLARQRERVAAVSRPDEAAAVQAPRREPHADAVVHEHLHARGAAVGEEVGVVRPGLAEDRDHARERRLGAGAHVEGLDRRARARRRGSPQQLAHPGARTRRQPTAASRASPSTPPRCSSIDVCRLSRRVAGSRLNATGTKRVTTAVPSLALAGAACASVCTMLALMPWAIAIFATEAPGAAHSASTSAFNSGLCRRRVRFLARSHRVHCISDLTPEGWTVGV